MSLQQIFFSYSRTDSHFALKLAQDLRRAGADVWIDQLDIPAGYHWDEAIEQALSSTHYVLVILSPASIASTNVMDEVSYALESGKKIIPVLLKDCLPPFRLKRLQRVDFVNDYETGLHLLIQSLKLSSAIPIIEKPDQPEMKKVKSKEHEHENKLIEKKQVSSYAEHGKRLKKYTAIAAGVLMCFLGVWSIMSMSPNNGDLRAWQAAGLKNDSLAYASYLRQFPSGDYYIQANQRIDSLRQLHQEVCDSFMTKSMKTETDPTIKTLFSQTVDSSSNSLLAPKKSQKTSSKKAARFLLGEHHHGGLVIYINSTGEHGLIVAMQDEGSFNWSQAQRKCASFKSEGYADWRLPTKDELKKLYANRKYLGPYAKGMYWSSTEDGSEMAWIQNFINGEQGMGKKDVVISVRAVRSF